MKKEEVMRVYKSKIPYPLRLLRVTKEHANSLPKGSMQHHAEEREEVNQGSPHYSNKIESCINGQFIEPPIQEALDEEDALTIIQHPSPEIKMVKAINMSTKKRMVTKKRRTIFMKKKRSTKSHPTPTPTSKFTQANNRRRLAGESHSKQGALTGSSFLLRSFLLTNWKKRKKVVNNISS